MKPCLQAWALGQKEWPLCEQGSCTLCDVTRAGRHLSDEQQVEIFCDFLRAAGPAPVLVTTASDDKWVD